MYSRPNPNETEEDLLRLQEEFQKNLEDNRLKLSAKIIPLEKTKSLPSANEANDVEQDIKDQLANTFESVPKITNIGKVVEKRKLHDNVEDPFTLMFSNKRGFPQAKRRNDNNFNKGNQGTGSLFSRHMKKQQNANKTDAATSSDTSNEAMEVEELNKTENIFSDGIFESKTLTDPDKEEIHSRNVKLLKETSVEELKEERNMLLEGMDPALLAYIKERHFKRINKSTNPTISKQNRAGENLQIEDVPSAMEILQEPQFEKWINFSTLESHKMAWMEDFVANKEQKIDKTKAFEARFDFEGWLMPFKYEDINESNRILYHHGEEPERPGYTLQELFTLARSSVAQQKILALNTISNILNLYSTGVYQDIIEIPIEQLFFLIRFCLDDNAPAVLNSSTKAMRSLIYSNLDEICLDCIFGFGLGKTLPVLPVDFVTEDDTTVNDQQLCETNIIRCLIRSGICTRIRYIFNTVKPGLETIVYCLEILIRLLKDSNFVTDQVLKCEGLMDLIITNFLPRESYRTMSNGFPILQAVKLIRVLSCRAKVYAEQFVKKYNLLEILLAYISDDFFGSNSNGIKLQTECFNLLTILFEYGLGVQYRTSFESILTQHLDYHYKQTSIDDKTTFVRASHCSSLLVSLNAFLKINAPFSSSLKTLVSLSLTKWSGQFVALANFKCEKSQIFSSAIKLASTIGGLCCDTSRFDDIVINILKSQSLNEHLVGLKECSMLLNNYEPQAFSKNLKTLQSAIWYTSEHIIPILKTNSPIPFLTNLSVYVDRSNNTQLKLLFLNNEMITEYISSLQNKPKPHLTTHWFTRIEAQVLVNLLRISVSVQEHLDTSIYYELAVKTLCVFNIEQKNDVKFILQNIVFCSSFYPSEVLLKNLNLTETTKNLELSLNNLNEILEVYLDVLGVKFHDQMRSNFIINIETGNIIPIDWIYTPIILLYNNQNEKNKQLSEEKQFFIVKNCLRWILIYETYFPTLVASVNPTERFCRLACVFLGSDHLFLNEEIHDLLELCLKNILAKFEDTLNFDKDIEGLTNFQDFYNQMLEQYQGVSYGDILFGNFIMVPLAQKQNVQCRKTFWSEYMGAVQVLNLTKETFMGNLDLYLNPIEENESLLKCYRSALMRNVLRKTSILYDIATHHFKAFLSKKNNKIS